jgi:hypothetical protein
MRAGCKELAGIATLAALEIDFLVSNCPGLSFIDCALKLVEEIANAGTFLCKFFVTNLVALS